MGVLGRIRDIINSNVNEVLDKNEDPETMINYIIRQMEDALIDLKASCADAVAAKNRLQRFRDEAVFQARAWEQRASNAIDLGREDLAREALLEKRRYITEQENVDLEIGQLNGAIKQHQDEMAQISQRLTSARDKKLILVQRHIHAAARKRSQEDIRRYDTSNFLVRFDHSAERHGRKKGDGDYILHESGLELEDEITRLEDEEWIERNLAALKARLN